MKELNKVIANQKKTIEALEEANNYLHSLREIYIMNELYKLAVERKYAKFTVGQIYIKNPKTKKYEIKFVVEIIFNNTDKSKFFRKEFKSFEELEGHFFGNVIENDEDLL